MTRTFRSLDVTGITRDGQAITGLVVRSSREVRDFLLAGSRLADGAVVESGWADLVCCECGESAAWCPTLAACLPTRWVEARR